MSDSPSWERTDELFAEALDLDPGDRQAFLDEACGDDAALRGAVQELLDAAENVGDFLEVTGPSVPAEALQELGAVDRALESGTVVDRYRIVGVLGRGGTSTVYDAERSDGSFDQAVALKVLRTEDPDGDLAVRFRLERQILADLAHPNIAKVFDGGMTADGSPYLVVEKVDGAPVTAHADEAGLDLEGRLRLFVEVARAIDHAHRSLVIHRDLKPSNILVDGGGTPKLLDFGIAKVLETEEGSTTADATRWMTPRYAAPEQILGRSVTTQTDVHALGLLLFEFLTGARPFGGDTSSRYEVERAICETEPKPPSTLATASGVEEAASPVDFAALGRTLSRDLDAIVLKALRKEPSDRYATAAAMADDVERFLEGHPVEALGGARVYRLKKFVRRNAVGVVTAAGIAALIVGGVIALAIERDRAELAAAEAQREAENAQVTMNFIAEVFQGREPGTAPSDTISAIALVELGEERVATEFEDRPEVKAELLGVLARAYTNLGYFDRAIRLHGDAVALLEETYGDESEEAVWALDELADAMRDLRQFEDVVPVQEELVRRNRALYGDASLEVTNATMQLAANHRDVGDLMTAVELAEEALARLPEHTTIGDGDRAWLLLTAGYVFRADQQLERAAELYPDGLARWRGAYGEAGTNYSIYLNNYAFVLRDLGRFEEAAATLSDVERVMTGLYGLGHPNTAQVRLNMIGVLVRGGRPDAADSIALANVEAIEAHWQGEHSRVAAAHMTHGLVRLSTERYAEATVPLRKAGEMFERVSGWEDGSTARSFGALAGALIRSGEETEGRALLDRVEREIVARTDQPGGYDWSAIQGLVGNLRSGGLEEEAIRFAALIPGG